MADTTFYQVRPAMKAVDRNETPDTTYMAAVSAAAGMDASKDTVFANTDPPVKAVYLGVDAAGNAVYGLAAVLQ